MKDRGLILLRHALVVLFGLFCLWAFARTVLCPFTDWNFNSEGVSADFINFFWHENFHFFKLPHFDWHSDCLLYPYGVDVTFIFWSFEMNAFGSLARSLDFAPWGQCYYLLSLAITFFGVYFLFWRRKGMAWSLFFAFALTFCNYASICKYPGHFSHCIVHWGILSVLLDVILVEKFWNDELVSARYFLTRILVMLLCFGLELGYIAGFACLSFFVTCVYLLFAKLVQTRSLRLTARWVADELQNVVRTFGASRWNVVLLVAIVLVAWVYLPIVFQIMANTPPQEKTPVWGTNPLRIFHPILPDFNPATTSITKQGIMGIGTVDTIYAWSAGLSAVLMCYFGMVAGGLGGIRKWLPFVLMLLAAMVMRQLPVITLFPAFKYARIPERLSPYVLCLLLIPLIFAIVRTEWDWRLKSKRFWVALPICLLWLVELGTAYFCSDTSEFAHAILEKCAPQVAKDHRANRICKTASTFFWTEESKLTPFTDEYKQAVETVRKLPGEALFFMPFSAHGGDAKGLSEYQCLAAHQMQFAARCGKKMNGCYLGRMFPEIYLKDFDRIAWAEYMNGKIWTRPMWDVLERFFKATDFAACAIDRSLLAAEQYEDVVRHLGASVASFDLHGQKYEIIPLPPQLRGGKKDLDAVLKTSSASETASCE